MIHPDFPYSQIHPFEETSQASPTYNCIAWAADDSTRWYEPDPLGIGYWPPSVPREYTHDSLVKVFESLGYSICTNGHFENGYEKVVVYEKGGLGTHAAKQLDPNTWTSKLGKGIDASHRLETLFSSHYGNVYKYLRRRKK